MRDFVLLCAVGAMFAFCYFLMKRLDVLLAERGRRTKEQPGDPALCVAFENPAFMDDAENALEQISREYPERELCLYYGSAKEIKKKLENNELAFGFVADVSGAMFGEEYASVSIPVRQRTVISDAAERKAAPLDASVKNIRLLWRAKGYVSYPVRADRKRRVRAG